MNLIDLCANGPILTDGAWGTELQKRGLPAGKSPDLWNLERPELVAEVAKAYIGAGSRVILTNTFRANRVASARNVSVVNRVGVDISRQAAAGRACVFGSLGPAGKRLAAGEIEPDEVSAAFAEQAEALAKAGADALVLETMIDLDEASLGLAAARTFGVPVIVSFSFHRAAGPTPEQAAQRMTAEGADGVGSNCGAGIVEAAAICRRMRIATSLPLWIKPNAGLPRVANGSPVYDIAPQEFARHVPALIEAGANFVGGCCGASPEFIRAIGRLSHAIQTNSQGCAR